MTITPHKQKELITQTIKNINNITLVLNKIVTTHNVMTNDFKDYNKLKKEKSKYSKILKKYDSLIQLNKQKRCELDDKLKQTSFLHPIARHRLREKIQNIDRIINNLELEATDPKSYIDDIILRQQDICKKYSRSFTKGPTAAIKKYKNAINIIYNPLVTKLNRLAGTSLPTKNPDIFETTPLITLVDDLQMEDNEQYI